MKGERLTKAIDLLKAVRSFERADTEMYRAEASGDSDRIWKAGNRYAMTKIRLFEAGRLALSREEGGE